MTAITLPRPASMPSLFRFLALLGPKRWRYIFGLTGRVLISTIERLAVAYLAKTIIDAMTSGDSAHFLSILMYWVLFYLGYLIVAPFVMYGWHSAVFIATAHIRETVFQHLQRLPLGYHELHHSGDALSILTNDVTAAEKAYQEDLLLLFEAIAQGISAAVFMLLLNWQLALLIILGGLAPLIINTLFAGPLRRIGADVQERMGKLSERMTDLLAGYQVIRTFNLGEWILSRFDQANQTVYESSLRRIRTEAALASANDFGGMFNFIPMMVGGYLVMTGQTTFGVLIGEVQLSNQIGYFVYSLGGTISRIQAALAAADRILRLMDAPVEPERYPALQETGSEVSKKYVSASKHEALIAFDQVNFGYNGDQEIFQSISFDVQPGQVVAFAGPSGGGKSTIFKLLLGCYPVKRGMICVNGKPLHEYRLRDLREMFAFVPQDAYLFSGSIYENIRFGKPGASEAEVTAAARAAFAHDFISEFPNGYQTIVGERGARLSGGQRQRIAIARALLKDAPILLLDEATSALDSESEQVVQQALEVLMKGRTTLMIAHRFSTILHANLIYVIDSGKVTEQGRHAELLEAKGLYASLFEMQYLQSAAETKTAA